jgi:hypothetical protein
VERLSVDDGRIRFLGNFACPFLERDFRAKHLREDIRLSLGCSVMVVGASVFFLLSGYRLYGTSAHFLILLAVRLAIILASLGLVAALRHCKSPAQADRSLGVW